MEDRTADKRTAQGAEPDKRYTYEEFIDIVKQLRSENGCPWDRVQTHESLRPCMMEEAAEVVASVRILKQTGNYDNLREELGDILLQVVMHSVIAQEEGYFTLDDVVDEIAKKMVRRHPHVFGDITMAAASEVPGQWEEIKKKEKAGKPQVVNPLQEVPQELPSLARATKVMKKIDKLYSPIKSNEESLQELRTLAEKATSNQTQKDWENSIGDMLFEVAQLSAKNKVYAEQVLQDRTEEIIEKYSER